MTESGQNINRSSTDIKPSSLMIEPHTNSVKKEAGDGI